MSRRSRCPSGGFTLIELMIVVSIIGLLAAILVPAVNGYLESARQDTTLTAMSQVKNALNLYKLDNSKYPPDLKTLGSEKSKKTKEPYFSMGLKDAWDEEYKYNQKDGGRDFELRSYGADRASGGEEHESDLLATKDKNPFVENP